MNPYEILDLLKTATADEIKTRYRQLAQEHHPDMGGNIDTFVQIKLAYEILSDPIRRKTYDESGITEAPVDRIKNEAITMIAQLMFDLIPQVNPDVDNIIVIMRKELVQRNNIIVEEIKLIRKRTEHTNKFVTRIKVKDDSENLVMGMVAQRLNQLEQDLARIKHQQSVILRCQEILAEYIYVSDLLSGTS